MSCAYVDPAVDPADPDPDCPFCGGTMVAEVDDFDYDTGRAFWTWVCQNEECEGGED